MPDQGYAQQIRESLAKQGHAGTNPVYVEGWMRLEHPTLDGLSKPEFDREVLVAVQCSAQSTEQESRSLAESFGLGRYLAPA